MKEAGGDAADSAFRTYFAYSSLSNLTDWYRAEMTFQNQVLHDFDIEKDGISRYLELCARTLYKKRTGFDYLTVRPHLVLVA